MDPTSQPGLNNEDRSATVPPGARKRLVSWAIVRLDQMLGWPIPAGLGWAHTLGSVLVMLLGMMLLTGWLLALYYSPTPDSALKSIQFVDQEIGNGRLIRSLHVWGASAVVVCAILHLLHVFLTGAFKAPRQLTWLVGVGLFVLILGMGFTGFTLPWDARAYSGTAVAADIGETAPIFGSWVRKLILGGEGLGILTLSRFYALHVAILPLAVLSCLIVHLVLVRRVGIATPIGCEDAPPSWVPFFPDHAWKDSVAGFAVLLVVFLLAKLWPAATGVPWDETPVGFVPRPEWYFLPLFQLLHYLPGQWTFVGAGLIPGAVLGLVILWPWLETGPERRPTRRKFALCLAGILAAIVLALGGLATRTSDPRTATVVRVDAIEAPTSPPLAAPSPATVFGEASQGATIYAALGCDTCHRSGPGPGLALGGSKLDPAWVQRYLLAPERIRYLNTDVRPIARMPNFNLSSREAADLAAYLDTLRDDRRVPPNAPGAGTVDMVGEGEKLFIVYKCSGCHVTGRGGVNLGPDLTDVASRLKPAYIGAFLADPDSIIPGTPMKDLRLWPEEVRALTAYLLTLRKRDP